jgi:hypothetical protein
MPIPKRPEDDWLTYERATKYLHERIPGGYTLRSLQQAKYDGKIPAIKIGIRIWFKRQELDAYIERVLKGAA